KRYEETASNTGMYNPRQRFTRTEFEETEQKFDLSDFQMKRTDEALFKCNYAMLNLKQLKYYRDYFTLKGDSNHVSTYTDLKAINQIYRQDTSRRDTLGTYYIYRNALAMFPEMDRLIVINSAIDQVRSVREIISRKIQYETDNQARLRGFG